jgi:hypothetical protein
MLVFLIDRLECHPASVLFPGIAPWPNGPSLDRGGLVVEMVSCRLFHLLSP